MTSMIHPLRVAQGAEEKHRRGSQAVILPMTVVPRDFTKNLYVPTSAKRKKRTRRLILDLFFLAAVVR